MRDEKEPDPFDAAEQRDPVRLSPERLEQAKVALADMQAGNVVSDEEMGKAIADAQERGGWAGKVERRTPTELSHAEVVAGAKRASERFEQWPAWKREVSEPSSAESVDRELSMSTAAFDEHDRLQAEAHKRATRAGQSYDEHWRHKSVLWAQGLLERYGRITVGPTGYEAWRDDDGRWRTDTTDWPFPVHATAREAVEAIIPTGGDS